MKKTLRSGFLVAVLILVVLGVTMSAHGLTSLQSAEGIIIVSGQRAMIDINGTSYLILRENSSYTQFENRHIRMYNIHTDYVNGQSVIDFTGFRFIDAFA